jgi:hypothetical protein
MSKRWKVVTKWLRRRADARRVNDALAALDTPSRLDRLDRPDLPHHEEWTEQKLLRLLHLVMRDDSSQAS